MTTSVHQAGSTLRLATCIGAAAVAASCATAGPAAPPAVSDLSARIDSIAASALEDGPVAGMSIAVARGGEVVHARGYGWADVESRVPATDSTVYLVASVSKLFTAVAVTTLVEDARLRLDDDLSRLLPDFPDAARGGRITLRHLLTHTSGLDDVLDAHMERWERTGDPLTPGFVLDHVDGRPLGFEPGERWAYSNTGFYLAGMIVERAGGRSYGAYVREAVAAPLGLRDTFLCDDGLLGERRTVGYEPADSGLARTPRYEPHGVETGYTAAGGICSTVLDLVRLPGALEDGGLLAPGALAEMLRPTALADGTSVDYGLGVRRGNVDGHRLWGHTGGSRSTWAVVAHYPDDDVTVAVLVNTDATAENAWVLAGRISRVALGLGDARFVETAMDVEALRPYPGVYLDPRRGTRFAVTAGADGRLRLGVADDDARAPTTLHPLGGHVFGWPDRPGDRLVFHVRDGRALGYSLYYDGIFAGHRGRVDP